MNTQPTKENDMNPMDVAREALLHYRAMWAWWLALIHTTDAERELARLKIALIDTELAARA